MDIYELAVWNCFEALAEVSINNNSESVEI